MTPVINVNAKPFVRGVSKYMKVLFMGPERVGNDFSLRLILTT